MKRQHLREGEEEVLLDYLEHPIKSVEERDSDLDRELDNPFLNDFVREATGQREDDKMRASVKAKLDQAFAKLDEYERNSSFGRSREEIMRNAKLHFQVCSPCYDIYKVAAETRIHGLNDLIEVLELSTRVFDLVFGEKFIEDGVKYVQTQTDLLRSLYPAD